MIYEKLKFLYMKQYVGRLLKKVPLLPLWLAYLMKLCLEVLFDSQPKRFSLDFEI